MSESEVLCFHCAQPIGDPPQLNELEEGEVCPVCRDRLLEELPPIVHSPVRALGDGRPGGSLTDADELDVASVGRERSVEADAEADPAGEADGARAPWPRLLEDEPGPDAEGRDEAGSGE